MTPSRAKLELAFKRIRRCLLVLFFFFQAEDGIRDLYVTGVQTCALPISKSTCTDLWQLAEVRRSDGGKIFLQQVQCVPDKARFGVISDIDDTVLQSNVRSEERRVGKECRCGWWADH